MKKFSFWSAIVCSIIGLANLVSYGFVANAGLMDNSFGPYFYICVFIVFAWVPFFVIKFLKLNLPIWVQVFYQLFMFLGLVAGSSWRLYDVFSQYDNILHFSTGVFISLFAYVLISGSKNVNVSLFWIFILTFSISMACGGFWEIIEFTADGITGGNCQNAANLVGREAIMDTMVDLICDFVGSLIGAGISVFYDKKERDKLKKINTESNNVES